MPRALLYADPAEEFQTLAAALGAAVRRSHHGVNNLHDLRVLRAAVERARGRCLQQGITIPTVPDAMRKVEADELALSGRDPVEEFHALTTQLVADMSSRHVMGSEKKRSRAAVERARDRCLKQGIAVSTIPDAIHRLRADAATLLKQQAIEKMRDRFGLSYRSRQRIAGSFVFLLVPMLMLLFTRPAIFWLVFYGIAVVVYNEVRIQYFPPPDLEAGRLA